MNDVHWEWNGRAHCMAERLNDWIPWNSFCVGNEVVARIHTNRTIRMSDVIRDFFLSTLFTEETDELLESSIFICIYRCLTSKAQFEILYAAIELIRPSSSKFSLNFGNTTQYKISILLSTASELASERAHTHANTHSERMRAWRLHHLSIFTLWTSVWKEKQQRIEQVDTFRADDLIVSWISARSASTYSCARTPSLRH